MKSRFLKLAPCLKTTGNIPLSHLIVFVFQLFEPISCSSGVEVRQPSAGEYSLVSLGPAQPAARDRIAKAPAIEQLKISQISLFFILYSPVCYRNIKKDTSHEAIPLPSCHCEERSSETISLFKQGKTL